MDLKQLEYFLACARHSSLTRAAEELYTTQPHVSLVIKSLEQELGVPLFQRKSKGVELTEEGRRIYSYARNAWKNVELMEEFCRRPRKNHLAIAANPSSHLAAMVTDYFEKLPENSLFLQYTECGIEEMLELVSEEEYDIGLLFAPIHKEAALAQMLERKRLEFVPLTRSDLVLHVGSHSPLYGRERVTPGELAGLRFIQMDDDFFSLEDMLLKVPELRRSFVSLNQVVRTNSDHTMIQMLRHTTLCNLGSYWVRDMYRQYNFGVVPIEGFEKSVSFGYLRQAERKLNPCAESFLNALMKVLRDEGGTI